MKYSPRFYRSSKNGVNMYIDILLEVVEKLIGLSRLLDLWFVKRLTVSLVKYFCLASPQWVT